MSGGPIDQVIKIVITGDSGVGKTNLMNRYVNDLYNEKQNPTVGLDFALKECLIGGQNVKCQIWDTAGQEKMKAIASAYYRNANGAVLVFDIANKDSFKKIDYWLNELRENVPEHISIILLGNKCDLEEKRQVAQEEAKAYAVSNGFFYLEVSAKTNENDCVTTAFDQLIAEILRKIEEKNKQAGASGKSPSLAVQDKQNLVEIEENKPAQKKKGCC